MPNSQKKASVTRNNKQRLLNKTIEPMAISSGSSALGQLDLMTPQIQLPSKQLQTKNDNDYSGAGGGNGANSSLAPHSLFSNRDERGKTTRFKKSGNPASNERGYGKQSKYATTTVTS